MSLRFYFFYFFYFVDFLFSFIKLLVVIWVYLCFHFLFKVFSFLARLSSLLGPLSFWCLALPVGVCSLECNSNNNNRRWLEDLRKLHQESEEPI